MCLLRGNGSCWKPWTAFLQETEEAVQRQGAWLRCRDCQAEVAGAGTAQTGSSCSGRPKDTVRPGGVACEICGGAASRFVREQVAARRARRSVCEQYWTLGLTPAHPVLWQCERGCGRSSGYRFLSQKQKVEGEARYVCQRCPDEEATRLRSLRALWATSNRQSCSCNLPIHAEHFSMFPRFAGEKPYLACDVITAEDSAWMRARKKKAAQSSPPGSEPASRAGEEACARTQGVAPSSIACNLCA